MNPNEPTNRLAEETSPYLRQHATNPVDWYPWGAEALALARKTGKPILLSIGYSACHWCHVMAHESFEDPGTAGLMNRLFVNIKVDREERPDLDRIYQTAQQLITQRSGGWPLTMFLEPTEQMPFFGGTYFPPQSRHGLPAFRDILERVADWFDGHKDELSKQGEAVREAFTHLDPAASDVAALTRAPIDSAYAALSRRFDATHGGFSRAPKFPNAGAVELTMRRWAQTAHGDEPDTQALYMAAQTLRGMALGGLFDHVGGGFCRYSVDERWEIPHFEKMLYDNALLLPLYAQMWRASGDGFYRDVAARTATWMLREMRAPDGGFFSSLDADSEGHEGRFYVWTPDAVRAALPVEQAELVIHRYGLDGPPNFEGAWHLAVRRDPDAPDMAGHAATLAAAHESLYEVRAGRTWPGLDDKILTSWNALAVRGLALAGRHLGDSALIDAATDAVDFLRETVWDGRRLLASYKDGRARFNGYLDDHAFMLDALIELLGCRWRDADLEFAVALADALDTRFADAQRGGYFFTSHDHETLLTRLKPMPDESTPSGNGVAARALQRLGYLLAEPRYLDSAERTLRAAWSVLMHYPDAHTSLLSALEETLAPPPVVVLRGQPAALDEWHAAIATPYAPGRLVVAIPSGAAVLPGGLADKTPRGDAVAYLCRGTTCSAPIDSLPTLTAALSPSA